MADMKKADPATISTHPTGAVRSNCVDDLAYELISPIALKRLAQTYQEGAVKYGAFNWEMGFPVSNLLRHALSHIYTYLSGDRTEDHLAHATWNLCAAIHSEELWPHLNGDLRVQGCVAAGLQPLGEPSTMTLDSVYVPPPVKKPRKKRKTTKRAPLQGWDSLGQPAEKPREKRKSKPKPYRHHPF